MPQRIQGNLALFAEQANALYLEQTYRQRVILLTDQHSHSFQIQYLALKQPEQFRGAAANPSKLTELSLTDLENLPGCTLMVTQQDGTFTAQPEPEAKCYFQYEGKTRQVILGFEVSAGRFLSYDRGVAPETGQSLWGAVVGPYKFNKCQDFAAELPLD